MLRSRALSAACSVFVLGIVLSLPQRTVQAADDNVLLSFSSGQGARVVYRTWDESGCVITLAVASAADAEVQQPPEPGEDRSVGIVTVLQSNICESRLLLLARGAALLGSDGLQVEGKLEQAHMQATIPAFDLIRRDFIDVTVDAEVTGGETLLQDNRLRLVFNRFGGTHILDQDRSHATFREGTATGQVAVDGEPLAQGPATFADVFESRNMSVTIMETHDAFLEAALLATETGDSRPLATDPSPELGEGAQARWASLDDCVRTTVRVTGSDFMNHTRDREVERLSFGGVSVWAFDFCSGRFITLAGGSALLEHMEFALTGNARQARLQHVFQMRDFVSGRTFEVPVDIAWEQKDEPEREIELRFVHFSHPDGVNLFHTQRHTLWADAVATGSVAIDGVNRVPGPSDWAQMVRAMNQSADGGTPN